MKLAEIDFDDCGVRPYALQKVRAEHRINELKFYYGNQLIFASLAL